MYDFRTLKPRITITDTEVECPVLGCTVRVGRHAKPFSRQARCPLHGISLSPATFEYDDVGDNLLWDGPQGLLAEWILDGKRGRQMRNEASLEALTWNVFRYLELSGGMGKWLARTASTALESDIECMYWGFAERTGSLWPELLQARGEFGESLQRGTEPAVIALGAQTLIFIDPWLTEAESGPVRRATGPLQFFNSYRLGGGSWLEHVFHSQPDRIAAGLNADSTARCWLLGSLIATQMGMAFRLVVVEPQQAGAQRTARLEAEIRQTGERRLEHTTWEALYTWVMQHAPPDEERELLLAYLRNKTLGYAEDGHLQPAFCV